MIPDNYTIQERLENLERQNRNLERLGTAAFLLMGVALLMGQARPSRTVEAEKIIVLDSHGRPRITIGTPGSSGAALDMKPDDPAIWMSDGMGVDRMILTVDGIKLADAEGRPADKP
jgi:hypothetical protein